MTLRDPGLKCLPLFRRTSFFAAVVLFAANLQPTAAQTANSPQPSQQTVLPELGTKPLKPAAGNPYPSSPNASAQRTQHAEPAAITLKDGTLTVEANNSDLGQILQEVSQQSGMVIEGQVKSTRVYGSYGPRTPSEVLTELLAGLDYNIIMIGTSREGAPRELKLTSRTAGPAVAAQPKAPNPPPTEEPRLGPGAVAHPPPAELDDPQMRRQMNLQRLQQMHDAQEKAKDHQ